MKPMSAKRITTPLTEDTIKDLKAGDPVLISGVIYTGRDAAHKRMVDALAKGDALPFDPQGQLIYYVGPTPAKPGQAIGSAGPTTSYRMDPYAKTMLEAGLKGMIGKGKRNEEVKQACKDYKAVYFGAVGGAGALIAKSIVGADVVAYPELLSEAVRRLEVKDFPAVVVNDIHGGDAYQDGTRAYNREDS